MNLMKIVLSIVVARGLRDAVIAEGSWSGIGKEHGHQMQVARFRVACGA